MSNKRIFYACQAVAISNNNTIVTDQVARGVQSVGINTSFNLEQVFELGQIQIYENIEGLPDVEVTLEKVIDGHKLLWSLATDHAVNQASLSSRSKVQCNLTLGIFSEDQDFVAGGTPPVEVFCSGMYVSSCSYTIPVDGNATESLTLVGNNKQWLTTGQRLGAGNLGNLDGADTPDTAGGGVQRRENFSLTNSIIPVSVYGVTSNNAGGANNDLVHLQNVSVSVDFGREDLLELGQKAPYYRAANFPIEVTCDIEVISVSGDFVSAVESADNNTNQEVIDIYLQNGMRIFLGSGNRLSSVSYGGGDAGGGNVTCTYSYSTFNDFYITDPDPSAID